MKYQNHSIPSEVIFDPLSQRLYDFKYQIYACRLNTQNKVRKLHNVLLPYIKIAVILEGECEITIQANKFHGKPGDCFLVPPYLLHSATYISEKLHSFEVIFQVNGLYHQEDYLSMFNHQLSFSNIFDEHHKEQCQKLDEAVRNKVPGSILELHHWISETTIKMVQNAPLIGNRNHADSALIQTVNHFLSLLQNDDFSANVEDYCNKLHVSQSYLCRCTLDIMQISPQSLIIQRRLFNSLKLLTDPSLTIEQISEILKYQSSSYFCSQFKKTFNMTPKQYRNNFRNTNA